MDVDTSTIPLVDFKDCSLDIPDDELKVQDLKRAGDALCKAFHEVGFAYLKNFGITYRQVDHVHALMSQFIDLPYKTKEKYLRKADTVQGWLPMELEKLDVTKPHDLKESFNYLPSCHELVEGAERLGRRPILNMIRHVTASRDWIIKKEYPTLNEEVPTFADTLAAMYRQCQKLTLRVLDSLGYGLNLSDPTYFSRAHNPFTRENITGLRVHNYPDIQDRVLEPGQLRCGAHTDWGTITLLFQDNAGGLQVGSNGGFRDATPIPDTMLLNMGDLMRRWSGDYFKSTLHRVVNPPTNSQAKVRRSIAFFVNADQDCEIVSLDGDKGEAIYTEPILMRDFMAMKIKESLLVN